MAETIKDLLIILIGSSLVSNVVLSQFLGLCPFLGVSKRVDTAVGMGGAVVFVITLASAVAAAILQIHSGAAGYYLFTDDRIYSGHCRIGTVRGNVPQEICTGIVSGTWRIPAADHNELCSTGYRIDECTEELWYSL